MLYINAFWWCLGLCFGFFLCGGGGGGGDTLGSLFIFLGFATSFLFFSFVDVSSIWTCIMLGAYFQDHFASFLISGPVSVLLPCCIGISGIL